MATHLCFLGGGGGGGMFCLFHSLGVKNDTAPLLFLSVCHPSQFPFASAHLSRADANKYEDPPDCLSVTGSVLFKTANTSAYEQLQYATANKTYDCENTYKCADIVKDFSKLTCMPTNTQLDDYYDHCKGFTHEDGVQRKCKYEVDHFREVFKYGDENKCLETDANTTGQYPAQIVLCTRVYDLYQISHLVDTYYYLP